MRALTRRNMLRLTGGLTIATLGSAALASCAPGAPSAPAAQPAEEGAPAPAPAGKTKLVFEWPQFTPEKTRYGEYIINTYMEQNPDIEIEPMYNTNPDEKLIVTIAGGTPPDCGWQGAGWQQFYKNFLVLDEFIERDAAEVQIDDYYEKLLGATMWQGQHQVLAQGFTVTLHYYNKKLFDEAGVNYPTADWTWDDFKTVGAAISDPDNNIYGCLLDQGSYYAPLYINGNFWSEDARQATFYSDMRVHLLQMWKDIWAKDGIGAPPTVTSEQGLMPMFEAGRIGIYAGGS